MLKYGERTSVSRKGVAFEDVPRDSVRESSRLSGDSPSSYQRLSTSSTYQLRASTSSARTRSASELRIPQTASTNPESEPSSRHSRGRFSTGNDDRNQASQTDAEISFEPCSIVDVKTHPGRPMQCGYHDDFKFKNGDSYEGEWRFGTLSGEGTYLKADGTEMFSGHFENDTLNGFGKHRDRDGCTYEGGFKNGFRHGRGKLYKTAKPTDHFECEWRDGMMKGKATIINYYLFDHKTGKKLEGDDALLPGFTNTLNQEVLPYPRPEARRRFDTSAGGRRYDFNENQGGAALTAAFGINRFSAYLQPIYRPHSPRTNTFLSKDCFIYKAEVAATGVTNTDEQVYEGGQKLCSDGVWRRYGKGTMRWGPGLTETYSGDWLYDEKHGTGERIWGSGEVYKGTWSHDRMEGKGSFRWPDGSKYNGQMVGGARFGVGTQTWPDPHNGEGMVVYEGEWREDVREGWGTLTCADGRRYDGEWRDGRIEGRGVLWYCNGWTYEGEFWASMKHGEGVRTELMDGYPVAHRVRYHYNVLVKRDSEACPKPSSGLQRAIAVAGETSIALRRQVLGKELALNVRIHESSSVIDSEKPLPISRPASPPLSPSDNAKVDGDHGRMRLHRQRVGRVSDKAQDTATRSRGKGGSDPSFHESAQSEYTSNWTLGERW